MSLFSKIALSAFVIFLLVNLYFLNLGIGITHEDNRTYLFSAGVSVVGIIATLALDTWRKLSQPKK